MYFKRKFLNFGIILKNGMPADTNALHRPVTEVANLEGPEELVAEDSQNTDFLFGQSPKQTMAAICLLPLTPNSLIGQTKHRWVIPCLPTSVIYALLMLNCWNPGKGDHCIKRKKELMA